MQDANRELVERIMALPILQAEWVLWFLFALSVLSLAIIVERAMRWGAASSSSGAPYGM